MSTLIRLQVQAVSNLSTVTAQLDELIKLTKQSQLAAQQAAQQAAYARQDEVKAIQSVQTAIEAQSAAYKQGAENARKTTQQTAGDLSDLERRVASFQALIVAAFSFSQLKQFGEEVIDAKSKIDIYKSSLVQMIGSQAEASRIYQELAQKALATPFTFEGLIETTSKLKAMGVATQDLIPTIDMLGNMAAAVGTDKMGRLAKAFTDVQNRGTLMAGEIRQFAEAGVPLFDLLAKSMDKPREAVVKMAEAHEISFAQVKKALMDSTAAGGQYYGLMAIQAQTLAGQTSNLADKFFFAKARIGDFFENEIRGGIGLLGSLMDALAGSDSAIKRTLSTVAAAASAWAAARTALSLYNAQTLINNGESDKLSITQRLLTASTGSMSAAFSTATGGIRGLWAAFSANPIGAILTGVSLLITAWQTWVAVNDTVSTSIGQQEYDLQREQLELQSLVNNVTAATEGTRQRKDAMAMLIAKYPDYFKGLDLEKTSNEQLWGILRSVNASYTDRINLAREAYRLDQLGDQQKELLERERAIFERIRNANVINEEVLASFGGNARKLMDYLKDDVKVAGDVYWALNPAWKALAVGRTDYLAGLVRDMDGLEKNYTESTKNTLALQQTTQASRLASAAEHHKAVMQQAKDGSAEEAAEIKRYEAEVADIKGTARKTEYKAVVDHAQDVKTVNVLTAKEMASLLKGQYQESYKEVIAALDAQEKAEMEAANKRVVNKKATDAQMKAMEADVTAELLGIRAKFDALRLQAWEKQKQVIGENMLAEVEAAKTITDAEYYALDERKKTEKEKRAESKKTAEEIKRNEEEVQEKVVENIKEADELRKEAAKNAKQMRSEVVEAAMSFVSSQGGVLGAFAGLAGATFSAWDQLSGKARGVADENLRVAEQVNESTRKAYYELGVGSADQVAAAGKNLQKFKAESTASVGEQAMAFMSLAGTAYQVFTAIADAFNAAERARWQATAEAAANARRILKEFSDYSRELYREMLDTQLETVRGNYAEQTELLEAYFAREKELVTSQTRIDDVLAFTQRIAEIRASDANEDTKVMETIFEYRRFLDTKGINERIAGIEVEKAKSKELRDARIANINDTYDAQKKALDQELADFNDVADKKKQRATQESEDRQLRLTEDDVFRQQLLTDGEAREIKALEEAKQRELAKAKDAEEKARIIQAFDKLIADKHAEYEDAKLDKTKAIKLATEEAKAKEKDTINALEEEKAAKALDVANRIKANELEAAHQKELANRAYTNSVRGMNEELFNANKQLQIVELQIEVAKLKARGGNAGLVNELNGLISRLGGTVYDNSGGKIFPAWKFDNASGSYVSPNQEDFNYVNSNTDGNGTTRGFVNGEGQDVEIFYNASRTNEDQLLTVYQKRADGKPGVMFKLRYADGYVPATGKRFAQGTEYVDGPYPTGTDTIPAMLNRGERVIPSEQNALLGNISNTELVARMLQPRLAIPVLPARLNLPGSVGTSNDSTAMLTELQLLRREIREKETLQLNIDNGGIAAAMIAQDTKTTFHANRFQF